jgi:hypothetical protein
LEKLQQGKEKWDAVDADLKLKTQHIKKKEEEKGEMDDEMEEIATWVKALETSKAIAAETITSLKKPAIDEIYGSRPVNSKRMRSKFPHCTAQ